MMNMNMETFDKNKLEEYQNLYTRHSKEARKYKKWIEDILKLEEKKQSIKSVPLWIKDVEWVEHYIKTFKRPFSSTELVQIMNKQYIPLNSRWKGCLNGTNFKQYIGKHLQNREGIIHWTGKSPYSERMVTYYQSSTIEYIGG